MMLRWESKGHLGSTDTKVSAVGWNDGSTTVLASTEWTPNPKVHAEFRDAHVQLFVPDLSTLSALISELTAVLDNHVKGVYSGE